MSIFDGVDFSKLKTVRAEKNIADDWDRKYITTRLEFEDTTGNPVFAVRSSYSIDDHLKVIFEDTIKVSCDNHILNNRLRLRSFGLHDLTEDLQKDIDTIQRLFDTSPDEIKRVY